MSSRSMGNVLVQLLGTKNTVQAHGGGGGGGGGVTRRTTSSTTRPNTSSSSSSTGLPRHYDHHQQQPPTFNSTPSSSSLQQQPKMNPSSSSQNHKKKKNKYDYIPDNFSSLHQVTAALRESGLESSNLIIGIDFTKSNEWTGKVSFNNRSLHAIGDEPNPYEKAISIIGKTLAPFDEDNLIPCFGFGDATTHDKEVFSFHPDHSPCHGFEEVLSCYKRIIPNLKLSGPTSFAPVIDAAVSIVEKSGGHFHVLVIIADGQVTRSINTNDMELSAQEERTISSIVNARYGCVKAGFLLNRGYIGPTIMIVYVVRTIGPLPAADERESGMSSYPLSIVLVGVGDGPWEEMKKFDDKIPAHEFDNFQFVNFTAIISKNATPSEKETAFALASLMEIPIQYTAAGELGLLGRVTGKAKNVVPRPPPVPYARQPIFPTREASNLSTPRQDDQSQEVCPICLTNGKDMAFGCGHMACRDCGSRLTSCPICRQQISTRLRLYTG